MLRAFWSKSAATQYPPQQVKLTSLGLTKEIDAASSAERFKECTPFLQQLFEKDEGKCELLNDATTAALALPSAAANTEERGPEPPIV